MQISHSFHQSDHKNNMIKSSLHKVNDSLVMSPFLTFPCYFFFFYSAFVGTAILLSVGKKS